MTIKIYHSSDSVLIRSTERDVELTVGEFQAIVRDLAEFKKATRDDNRDATVVSAPALSVVERLTDRAAKPTPVKSRHGEPWTKEEDERMLAGRRRGETMAVIAKALGRSEAAASVRLSTKYKGYSANLAAAAE